MFLQNDEEKTVSISLENEKKYKLRVINKKEGITSKVSKGK